MLFFLVFSRFFVFVFVFCYCFFFFIYCFFGLLLLTVPSLPAINALDVDGRVLCDASKLSSAALDENHGNSKVWH